jgi:hypothetical protein
MLVAIIAAMGAIIVGCITAFVTIRVKKIELVGQSEQRRHADLTRGYNLILASVDASWHYRCHRLLEDCSYEPPFDVAAEWPELRAKIDAMLARGNDLLAANSANYDHLAPALIFLTKTVLEGVAPGHLEARPEDYEAARSTVIWFSRIDARIDKQVDKNYWRKFAKENTPRDMVNLDPEDSLRRIYAVLNSNQAETVVFQAHTDEEVNVFVEFIHRFRRLPKLLVPSLETTFGRMEHWRSEDVMTFNTPCTSLDAPCYILARRAVEAAESE